jgi:hypothetical protein
MQSKAHSPKEEIRRHWNKITAERRKLGMAPLPAPELVQQAVSSEAIHELRECAGEFESERCDDTCSIKDSICDSAENICRIADELGHDEWADKKCHSATASCEEATKRCCSCLAEDQQESTEDPPKGGSSSGATEASIW